MQAISPRDVQSRLEKGEKLQIIDVREPGEVASGKIPGAKNIPLGQIPNRLHEVSRNVETIMVCRSGGRSGRACEFLVGQGFENVKNMSGGMLSWSGKVE
ncbi:rhodanese-like domain-containing protein [Alicyclobacillus sp. ALC3]|uniref:rhodanese-like domain-containing protein n=1 Tax=Alicyclobacillus sp. ALC3 TaxID=2796143 RepID=UPI00237A0073|nr:rhodanese-like domain-containing protein [Alicyclobacillus sp. ALC3]WDL99375.1 rhodanese-like domain-containing protein [Alicyclobacillus sp. ALC3]